VYYLVLYDLSFCIFVSGVSKRPYNFFLATQVNMIQDFATRIKIRQSPDYVTNLTHTYNETTKLIMDGHYFLSGCRHESIFVQQCFKINEVIELSSFFCIAEILILLFLQKAYTKDRLSFVDNHNDKLNDVYCWHFESPDDFELWFSR